jgi:uncharacterized phage-associated protein
MSLDPRSVANLVIEEAMARGRPITHLSLQKILYFIQGKYLMETGLPLMSGFFEAWQYGPVHPLIYDSFKDRGAKPLTEPAAKQDLLSGRKKPVDKPADPDLVQAIRDIGSAYLKLTPGRLVDLSHAKGSPWDVLTKMPSGGRSFGFRITDEIIKSRFQHHKMSVSRDSRIGEPDEESPPY